MTTMARCLEGHAFDTDASATCPICGSTVWRDAVKEAAEKAAREAREAKAAKEAKAAREAAERIEKAKEAKAAKAAKEAKAAREAAERAETAAQTAAAAEQGSASPDGARGTDVVARAAQAARDAREAKVAREAAERIEAAERAVLATRAAAKARSADAAAQADAFPNAGDVADRAASAAREARASRAADGVSSSQVPRPGAATDGVTGTGTKGRGAKPEPPLWVSLLTLFVGLPALLSVAYLFVASSQVVRIYQEYGRNQPDNTALENVVYTALLELRHGFQARATDVPYGPNAGRSFRSDGLVSTVPSGEPTATPTRGVPQTAIRDALTHAAPIPRESVPETIPNPFATPKR